MKPPEPEAVLILLILKIAAYFLVGFGLVLVVLGALQYSYLRTAAPDLFPGGTTAVGLFCMALGCAFTVCGFIMAVWLRVKEKRVTRMYAKEMDAKGREQAS